MKAVILAAGTASRLRPLTNDTPKCLLSIGRRCLLERSMDALIAAGIKEFVIVTGFQKEKIETFVRNNYRGLEVDFIYNSLYASTNNIYSLWLAREQADNADIMLLDSDLLYDPEIVKRVINNREGNVLTLIRHALGEEEMKVVADGEGRILQINKTCDPSEAIGESLGIEKMSASYTRALYAELEEMILTEQLSNIFYERAFERIIPKGHTFSMLDVSDLFSCELDTIEDFETARQKVPAALF